MPSTTATLSAATAAPAHQKAEVPFTVPAMTPSQRRRFRALVLLWLAAACSFLLWWFQGQHVVTVAGMVLNTGVLFWMVFVQGAWYFFFVGRMRRPNPACPVPEGAVAIVVTKAPSEPWPLVRRTLEGMLRQDFPRPYDVWLADEDPDDETRRWCAAHGVHLSCRKGVAGYHNKKWPRRTRCKEGNLSYFYDQFGYAGYDFVAQLDADHVPEPSYLSEVIRPFADPGVGYVAAPSICDSNAAESWAARARLYAEAALHGPLQMGYAAGFAPLCIGSHYAVRTRALREIGGLGPELAEDHSTTLLLNAAGWRGAFAVQAIAHGDGPASLTDYLTQEFQWSRSLVNILLTVTPRYWSRLPLHLQVQFAFCQLWYVGLAAAMLLGYTFPIVALVTGMPWANVNLAEFYVQSGILLLATLTAGEWVRRLGWFRPQNAPLLSWEIVLGNLLRWPWVALGVIYAIVDSVLKKEFAFKVTPKQVAGARRLHTSVLFPYVLLAAAEAAAALLVRDPGQAAGYYYLALVYSATYVLAAGAAVVLHLREQGHRLPAPSPWPVIRLAARPLALAIVAAALTVSAGAVRWTQTTEAIATPYLTPGGGVLAAMTQAGHVLAESTPVRLRV